MREVLFEFTHRACIESVHAIAHLAERDDGGIGLDAIETTQHTFRKYSVDSVTTKTEFGFKIVIVIHFSRKENDILHFIASVFFGRYNPSLDAFWILGERRVANIIHFFGRHDPADVVFFP